MSSDFSDFGFCSMVVTTNLVVDGAQQRQGGLQFRRASCGAVVVNEFH
jgi:hypothetical protein